MTQQVLSMSLDETLTQQDKLGQKYLNENRALFESIQDSPRAKIRPFNNRDYYILGEQLRKQKAHHQRVLESAGTLASLGVLPKVAAKVITLLYATSPIGELAGIQPIRNRHAYAILKDFEAFHSRGTVSAGQKLLSTLNVPDVTAIGYANNTIQDEPLVDDGVGEATNQYEDLQIGGTDELMTPLYERDMSFKASIVFTTGHDPVEFGPIVVNPKTHTFSEVQSDEGSNVFISGSVDVETGKVQIDLSAVPDGATKIWVTYQVMPGSAPDVPRGHPVFLEMPITAEDYVFASDWDIFQRFTAEEELGIDLENEIIKDLTFLTNYEMCNKLMRVIKANVPSGNLKTWERKPLTGTSSFEHAFVMRQAFNDADNMLQTSAMRGSVTCWAIGKDMGPRFLDLPEFKHLYERSEFGPHIFGTWNGATIVRFSNTDVVDANEAIGIGKISDYEAPALVGEYMPFMTTDTAIHGENPTRMQKAVVKSAAIAPMVPRLSTRLLMDDADYKYGTPSGG